MHAGRHVLNSLKSPSIYNIQIQFTRAHNCIIYTTDFMTLFASALLVHAGILRQVSIVRFNNSYFSTYNLSIGEKGARLLLYNRLTSKNCRATQS